MKRLIVVVLISMTGCRDNTTTEQRYINYINDPGHKITQQISIGEVQTTVKWLPPDYRELKNNAKEKDTADKNDDGLYFFEVKFDKVKGDKPGKEKLLYLNFDIQKDFVLLDGRDSLMPVICQKIENGIGGSYQYMLAFEKPGQEKQEDFAVLYNDKIFGIGTLAFVYSENDIRKIPKLKPGESK